MKFLIKKWKGDNGVIQKDTLSRKAFNIFNWVFLGALAIMCVLPLIHVLAVSFSSKPAVDAGYVGLWPIDFTLMSYEFIYNKKEFITALIVSIKRLVLGVPLSMLFTILISYPLSKDTKSFRFRTVYVWVFMVTILFSGGLIPTYMTIKMTGLMDSIWALVLPSSVQVFNIVLMLNFFRGLPKEIEESAFVDGAGHWTVLWRIFVPISKPSIATILLFTTVGQWNSWFDGLLYMNTTSNYPLQTYLQTLVTGAFMSIGSHLSSEDWRLLQTVSDKTAKSAQIFLGALPILVVYPFLQRYFVKGIVLGSVKG